MKSYLRAGYVAALLCGLTPVAWGQPGVPAVPAVPAAPAVPGVPGVPGVAAPGVPGAGGLGGANNIWSFFCMTAEQRTACQEKFCKSPLNLIFGAAMAPAQALSGGLLQGCCPPALASELAQPADSPTGAAARIKEDEANAKKRRADVRYLGTVDCRYWPEAKEALINALRADKNECVRFEAALSLGNGCCCNKATIRALTISVSCSDEDGNPPEPSERVRVAAAKALHHCLENFCDFSKPRLRPGDPLIPGELPPPRLEEVPVSPPIPKDGVIPIEKLKDKDKDKDAPKKDAAPTERGPKKTEDARAPRTPREYYVRVMAADWERIRADAKAALAKHAGTTTYQLPGTPAASQSLTEVVTRSLTPTVTTAVPVPVTTVAPPVAQPTMVVTPPVAQPTTARPASRPIATGLLNGWISKPTPPPVIAPAPVITTTPAATPTTGPGYVPLPPPGSQPITTPVPASNTRSALTPSDPPVVRSAYSGVVKAGDVRPAVATQPTTATQPVVRTTYSGVAKASDVRPAVATQPVVTQPVVTPTPITRTTYGPAGATRVTVTVHPKDRLLVFFHRSTDFRHREWAAGQMALLSDGGKDEQVVAALLRGAETDTAPTVRIACLVSIRTLGIKHPRVATILKKLQGDMDVRVKATAVEMQRWLDGGVQQVSHTTTGR